MYTEEITSNQMKDLREQHTWLSTRDAAFEPEVKTPTSFTVRGGAFEPSTVLTLTCYIQRAGLKNKGITIA